MLKVVVGHSFDPDSQSAIDEVLEQCGHDLAGISPKAGILLAAMGFDHAFILQCIQQRFPGLAHYPEAVPEIEKFIQTIELKYLVDDLPKIMRSMSMGTERIQEIVLSLRTFSRMDEAGNGVGVSH